MSTQPGRAIDTPRLSLRPHREADFDDMVAMWSDPNVVRYISDEPSNEHTTWSRLLRYVGHWTIKGYGYWAIRERETGRFVGDVGLSDFRRVIDPPLTDPEAGWVLASWAHGKGLATEAVRAILAWGEEHLRVARTVCIIAPDNVASIRVAEKCGYTESYRTAFMDEPTLVLHRPQESVSQPAD